MDYVDDRSASSTSGQFEEKLDWLRDHEIDKTALRKFLKSRNLGLPDDKGVRRHIAETLSNEDFKDLKNQFEFAGRCTLNYFVVTGVSNRFDTINSLAESRFPIVSDVEEKREPFLLDTTKRSGKTFLRFGYYEFNKEIDFETNTPTRTRSKHTVVVVIRENTDLVEVRSSDVTLSRKICKKLSGYVVRDAREGSVYDAPFSHDFQKKLSKDIEKFLNVKLKYEESEDKELSTIKFSSRKNEDGEYIDVRNSKKVQKERNENNGEICMGHTKLDSGLSFHLNKMDSKVTFRYDEREERLNKLTETIDDILRETGAYTQRSLPEFT